MAQKYHLVCKIKSCNSKSGLSFFIWTMVQKIRTLFVKCAVFVPFSIPASKRNQQKVSITFELMAKLKK